MTNESESNIDPVLREGNEFSAFNDVPSGDHGWYTEWFLRAHSREEEGLETNVEGVVFYRHILRALHEDCSGYAQQTLRKFPADVAKWIGDEAGQILDGAPSRLFKGPEEASFTPLDHHRAAFDLFEEQWQQTGQNTAVFLKLLEYCDDEKVLPPLWALKILIKSAARVSKENGGLSLDQALTFTPGLFKKVGTFQRRNTMAALVAEGVDAALSHGEARELAAFEVETVYGWPLPEDNTLKKYYETTETDRDGFAESYLICFQNLGYSSDEISHSFMLPFWRRKSIRARLEAHRYCQEQNLDREASIKEVTRKTISALRRNFPPKTDTGRFSERDF